MPIVSFIPLFMFAILFGLSMDYEVFLLSRVREEYRRHGDNTRAVIAGIAGTGRTITAAALIMVAVFSGFVLGSDPVVKMMGVGLATAIFLDATVVRLVLVPATMKLLGDANWWLPGWLDRLLPELDPASGEETRRGGGGPSAAGFLGPVVSRLSLHGERACPAGSCTQETRRPSGWFILPTCQPRQRLVSRTWCSCSTLPFQGRGRGSNPRVRSKLRAARAPPKCADP